MKNTLRFLAGLLLCPLCPLPAQSAYWVRDNSFSSSVQSGVTALQPDGKLLAALPAEIVRLDLAGARDASFSSPLGTGERISKIALQPDGMILAFGTLFVDGRLRSTSVRLEPNGRRDGTYASVAESSSSVSVPTASDGSFYVSTQRFFRDGQPDSSFQASGLASFPLMSAPLPDGGLLVAPRYQMAACWSRPA